MIPYIIYVYLVDITDYLSMKKYPEHMDIFQAKPILIISNVPMI